MTSSASFAAERGGFRCRPLARMTAIVPQSESVQGKTEAGASAAAGDEARREKGGSCRRRERVRQQATFLNDRFRLTIKTLLLDIEG